MADVKWIKLATGLPDNRKIKQIRRLPDGDTIALMWIFLMCLAGETNDDGMVYFMPEIPYTEEMLSDQFDIDINTVRLGITTFQRFGMIEIIDNIICLPAWEKWQSVDKLSEMREKTRLRVAKHREKQRISAGSVTSNVTSNVTVTECNAVDIDTDIDREIEKDNNNERENTITKEETKEKTEVYKNIIAYLNEKAGTRYKYTTGKTRSCIHARFEEGFTLDDFKVVIDKKCADWIGTDYEKYLRPETLFSPKFEGYLNEKPRKAVNNNGANRNDYSEYTDGRYGTIL